MLKYQKTHLPGVLIIEPEIFNDSRGYFFQTYHQKDYEKIGIKEQFVQDNHSFSRCGVIRGLHYQKENPQGKLVYVIRGEIFDVAVDINKDSPTFGHHVGVYLSSYNRKQLYIPPGYAHGFACTSEEAYGMYKCTDFFSKGDDKGVLWSDPTININWPVKNPIISERDQSHPLLKNI